MIYVAGPLRAYIIVGRYDMVVVFLGDEKDRPAMASHRVFYDRSCRPPLRSGVEGTGR